MTLVFAVLAGFALDFAVGDPRWLPHPVVGIGKLITLIEKLLRKLFPKTDKSERIAGALLWFIVCGVSFFVPLAVAYFSQRLDFWPRFALRTWFSFRLLAARSLMRQSTSVCRALECGDLSQARQKLSLIVGRDTERLGVQEITKATVETVSENTSDGVVAPLLFLAIGGVPLCFLYKAVNTLDSMVGYKNEKYLNFGRFSARADDIFNFLPARIAGFLMIVAAHILRLDGAGAARIFRRDRRNHPSPNSAQTESACAGALGIRLGGGASYFGVFRTKPIIGDDLRPAEAADIQRSNRLMYVTAALAAAIFCAVRAVIFALI